MDEQDNTALTRVVMEARSDGSDGSSLVQRVSPLASHVEDNPVHVYLSHLRDGSRRTMLGGLNAIARWLTSNPQARAVDVPWWLLTYGHMEALRTSLMETHAHTTANKMLSAVRGVLKVCWRQGRMSAEQYHLAASIENVDGERVMAGREIQTGEIAALLRVCSQDSTIAGRRDAALIALLYGCGLRRAEAAALTMGDWRRDTQALTIQGKRNKQRIAYVADTGAFAALLDWLAVRGVTPDAEQQHAPLFVRLHKSGTLTQQPLTPQGIRYALMQRIDAAQVASLTPHDFRRTFISNLLDAGVDIVTVQKMAGHANPTTTSRYDRRGEQAKIKAAALLHVPYQRHE